MPDYTGNLKKKAKGKSLGSKKPLAAPKLIIGDTEEQSPGQTSVKEQTIKLGGASKRGGKQGVTIGRRPMANRSMGGGVTTGMGNKGRRRY